MNDAHRKSRLNHLIATDFDGRADFAQRTGTSKARVTQMAGEDQPFGEAAARNLAAKLDLHEDWFNHTWPTPKEAAKNLYNESRGHTVAEQPKSYTPTTPPGDTHLPGVDVLESDEEDLLIHQYDVGGGMGRSRVLLSNQPGIIKSWRVNHDWLRQNVPSHSGAHNLAIVTGFGNSMLGMFNPGDPLLVDMGCKVVTHDAPYFFRIGEEGYIKLLQRIPEFDGPGHVIRAISKNADYPPFDVNPKNPHFEVLGKVLTVWKSEHY